jgi:hypothetical protein
MVKVLILQQKQLIKNSLTINKKGININQLFHVNLVNKQSFLHITINALYETLPALF